MGQKPRTAYPENVRHSAPSAEDRATESKPEVTLRAKICGGSAGRAGIAELPGERDTEFALKLLTFDFSRAELSGASSAPF